MHPNHSQDIAIDKIVNSNSFLIVLPPSADQFRSCSRREQTLDAHHSCRPRNTPNIAKTIVPHHTWKYLAKMKKIGVSKKRWERPIISKSIFGAHLLPIPI